MMYRLSLAAGLLCVALGKHDKVETKLAKAKADDIFKSTARDKELSESSSKSSSASQGGSQAGGYQQYMDQYAGAYTGGAKGGSQGSQSGGYQHYMKQYAGGAQGGSQGSQSGDYQQYMNKYAGGKQANGGVSLLECNTTAELKAWKSREMHNMKKSVPSAYAKYAENKIERQYKERLAEIKHAKSNTTEDSDSSSSTDQAILDLAATPAHAEKEKAESKSNGKENAGLNTFLAQFRGVKSTDMSPATLAFLALVCVAFTCLVFFVKHNTQSHVVNLPVSALG